MTEWISVEDRLPENEDGAVLFWFNGGAYTGWPVKCGDHWETADFDILNIYGVTHWRPIMEPPQ